MDNVDNFDLVLLSAVDDPILAFDYLANVRAIEPFDNSPGSWEGCKLITSLEYAVYELVRLLF
jgi:hypothetical protein